MCWQYCEYHTTNEVQSGIQKLEKGTAAGSKNLCSDHLIYIHNNLCFISCAQAALHVVLSVCRSVHNSMLQCRSLKSYRVETESRQIWDAHSPGQGLCQVLTSNTGDLYLYFRVTESNFTFFRLVADWPSSVFFKFN